MSNLSTKQLEEGFFCDHDYLTRLKLVHSLSDYDQSRELRIMCSQLDFYGFSSSKQKRIAQEWISFLTNNPQNFKVLHFSSSVSQAMFDAICSQVELEELYLKWGHYHDLSKISNLIKLKYLYIGSGAKVDNLEPLTSLTNLVVLHIENFKRIEDYSVLAALENLEQLIISGPILGKTGIKDIDFLTKMKNLKSVWLPNTIIRKKYTKPEYEELKNKLKHVHFINDCF